MPTKFTMNVSLTEHLHAFVAAQVAAGGFASASEVVRAALRLLEHQHAGEAAAARRTATGSGGGAGGSGTDGNSTGVPRRRRLAARGGMTRHGGSGRIGPGVPA